MVVMYDKPSVGTSMEVLFAWERDIPVVVIVPNVTWPLSPWLKYHAARVVDSLEAARDAFPSLELRKPFKWAGWAHAR